MNEIMYDILSNAKLDFCSDKKEKQPYWVRILNVDHKIKNRFLRPGLKFTFGEDLKYGLGIMDLVSMEEKRKVDVEDIRQANYLSLDYSNVNDFIGLTIEMIRYERREIRIKSSGFYYLPGNLVKGKKIRNRRMIYD